MPSISSWRGGVKVFEPGTRVLIGLDRDMPAEITAVKWLLYGIVYELTWWEDATVREGWFSEPEFSVKAKKKDFGFGNGTN